MSRFVVGVSGVFLGMVLLMFYYFRLAAPLMLVYPILGLALHTTLEPQRALELATYLMMIPSIAFLALILPFFFGSYFQILKEVGFFLQRVGTFTPQRAKHIVMSRLRSNFEWLGPTWCKVFGIPA